MSAVPPIDISPAQWEIVRRILLQRVPAHEDPLSLGLRALFAEDFAESNLPWKVDVVDWAATSETFRKIIESDRVVLQKV